MLSHSPTIVTDGLVLYLDAKNTRSYGGSGTTIYDLSYNDNSGSLVGNVSYSSLNGGALDFDGSADYISCNVGDEAVTLSSGFTVNMFVQIDNLNNQYTSFFSNYVNTISGTAFALKIISGKLEFRSYGLSIITTSPNNFPIGEWIMISVSWKPGTYAMYENGVVVKTGSATSTYVPSQSNIIRICGGAYSMGIASDMDGKMAITQLYNRALTQEEVTQNFKALRGRFGL